MNSPAPLIPSSPNAAELEKRKRYLRTQLAERWGMMSPSHRNILRAELRELERAKVGGVE